MGIKTFSTLDLYLSAYLSFKGVTPNIEFRGTKAVFLFPTTDELYRVMTEYNSNISVPINDFVTEIKKMRGQMLSLKGIQK